MIEQFQEVYYSENDEGLYDKQVTQLSFLLDQFCKCANEAIYNGFAQNAAWQCKMVELGAYVATNKLVRVILRDEENDKRTR